MEPIFDCEGRVVGWLADGVIHDQGGRCKAFVNQRHVFGIRGALIGGFEKGFFRDLHGRCVAFVKGAKDGPPLPICDMTPIPPIPERVPTVPKPPPSLPRMPTGAPVWSHLEWDAFLGE